MTRAGFRWRAVRAGLSGMLVVGLAACDRAPAPADPFDDQVMARLPDGEITRFELRHEPRPLGESPGATLERVIDRKLLAARARAERAEDDPEYLAALRRTREDLLVDALRRKLARATGQPSDAALRAFAVERPWMFAQRALLELEDGPEQTRRILDTAALDRAQWQALTPREGRITIAGQAFRVVSVERVPVDAVQDRNLAVRLWQREQVERSLQGTITAARQSGAVRYRPGLGPAARRSSGVPAPTH